MSRSYKKNLCIAPKDRWFKRYANRRLRRMRIRVQDGMWYKKKVNMQYNICDYILRWNKDMLEEYWWPKWKWRMK